MKKIFKPKIFKNNEIYWQDFHCYFLKEFPAGVQKDCGVNQKITFLRLRLAYKIFIQSEGRKFTLNGEKILLGFFYNFKMIDSSLDSSDVLRFTYVTQRFIYD